MDHEMFRPQIALLSGRFRCIAWDERGHGRTASGQLAPFTYYDSADDLVAILDHLGIERAVLIGMSQGGFLSLRCALTHPKRVAALVLIDTQPGLDDPVAVKGFAEMMHRWIDSGLSDEIANAVEHALVGDGWPGAAAWKAKWATIKPADLKQCIHTLTTRDDITHKMSAIGVPTLVIHGRDDHIIPPEKGERLAAAIPGAKLALIEGAAHAPNLTHAQVVNEEIVRFLDKPWSSLSADPGNTSARPA
jgi:pimeloyl-ACP methyl ester carboxylesterase